MEEMPSALSSSRGPIPESNRIWGVLIEPAERMTSFVAVNVFLMLPKNTSQTCGVQIFKATDLPPDLGPSSTVRISSCFPFLDWRTRVAWVLIAMSRFGRLRTGVSRKAVAALLRSPLPIVD